MVPLLGAGYRAAPRHARPRRQQPGRGRLFDGRAAADVKGALDVLGIAKVHYVGSSIGGMIGQPLHRPIRPPAPVARLCDTQPSTPPGSTAAWDERKTGGAQGRHVSPCWPTAPWSAGSPTSSSRSTRRAGARCATRSATPRRPASWAAPRRSRTSITKDRLHTIKTPTLVIRWRRGCRHAAPGPQPAHRFEDPLFRRPLRRYRQGAPPAERRAARAVQPHPDELDGIESVTAGSRSLLG